MANYLMFMLIGIVILATGITAQEELTSTQESTTSYYCPSSPSGIYCRCYMESSGYRIECDTDYYSYTTPEETRDALEYYQSYGPVVNFYVYGITQSYFSYVPDNFLAGIQIPNVRFQCSHSHSVNGNLLLFSLNAFKDNSGVCGLTGNATFRDCNLRQFDTATFTNCYQLKNLAFMDSHVETLINIPTLESLKNFTVYSPTKWTGATQRGLSRMTLAPGASLPQLTYLDLTGNSLQDDSIEFVSKQTTIEEIHLEGNNFGVVPNLTDSFYLHTFSVTLNSSASDLSILLPNPRTQLRPLRATFDSSNSQTVYDVTSLQGMFGQDIINLKLNMVEFKESTFFSPLSESDLTVNLNPAARIKCGCSISWLVRDNPSLLAQVNNGICTDGRPFESVPAEEVVCCSTESLLRRINVLQKKIKDLEAVKQLH